MKKITLLFLLIFGIASSQEIPQLKFSSELTPIVVKIDSIKYPKEIIYSKIKDWVQYYYHSPKDVLKSDVANEMIRFDGYKENGIKVNAMISQVEDLRYTIQIDIKDGKYRLSLISMERYFKDTVRNQYSISSRWIDVMSEVPLCFKKNGDLKSYCKYYPNAFEGLINDINTSVYNFITNNTVEKSKNDNW